MTRLREQLRDALSATDAGAIALGAHRVRLLEIALTAWAGPRPDTLADDCRKRGGLVVDLDGEMSCTEVEVVRRLRAAGWEAGWVQGFPCGRARWSRWIWQALPAPVDAASRRVQVELGGRASSRSPAIGWSTSSARWPTSPRRRRRGGWRRRWTTGSWRFGTTSSSGQ